MGHSRADKAATHRRIVDIAARRFRERGLDGIGVADLMKEAGLTVGGFYKHFASRSELVAEAMSAAFGVWRKRRQSEGGAPGLDVIVDEYLSPAHRDAPGYGCAFAALSGEIARADEDTRRLATEEIQRNFDFLAEMLPGPNAAARRSEAIAAFSAMVGGLALARVVNDEALSEEILATLREKLSPSVPPVRD